MTERGDIDGPWIVWENYGCEGWQPKSYPTAKDALTDTHYNRFILTKVPTITVLDIDRGVGEKMIGDEK